LKLERVGVHDNFFDLGGDSILSIQVISRLKACGLNLTPRQFFEHQEVAALARVIQQARPVDAEQGRVTGEVPLLPIQHWFFAQEPAEPWHFNQAMLLELKPRLELDRLQSMLQVLLEHHDALRLRFHGMEGTWWQAHAAADESVSITQVDLSDPAEPSLHQAAIEQAATEAQSSLNLEQGPLLRAVHFRRPAAQSDLLLLVVHHLAVDGVSWRILLSDLEQLYEQLTAGQSLKLPAKTTSYRRWAQRLIEYSQTEQTRQELDYWLSTSREVEGCTPFPVDDPQGDRTTVASETIVVRLDAFQTEALLRDAPEAYRTQINDLLLTALAQANAQWSGQRKLAIHLEGHGREDLFDDVDLSRTVGWFTSLFPVVLQLDDPQSPGASIKAVKEKLRAVPQRGIGYGVLRYLCDDTDTALLRARQDPAISFNYLGQVAVDPAESQLFAVSAGSVWQALATSMGPSQSPRMRRTHLLEINGLVTGGCLEVRWTYSPRCNNRTRIQALTEAFRRCLLELVEHCVQPESGGFTPSDFPLAGLDQQALDRLFASSQK
jgi:non-ribosomal peptide synthase protein (TIGR01720 family)